MSDEGAELVREANHRVANSLALIASLVRMQAVRLEPATATMSYGEAAHLLDTVAARIATVGQLHRLLAYRHEGEAIDIASHLKEICWALIDALTSADRPVELEFDAPGCVVASRCVQPLSLIVSELVINAIKYAHPSGLGVRVSVGCRTTDDGTLVLTVADDGVGFPDGFDPHNDGGLGFRVVRSLAERLGACLDFESDRLGVRFRLALPEMRR